jgi:hypothetical protein
MTEIPDLVPAQQEVDLVAVQRDDQWLGQLGGREAVTGSYGVLGLLRALTVEVDDGLPEVLDRPLPPARPDPAERVTSMRRRNGTRAAVAALLATGLVSMSGVAAAVTGDPFSPYRQVFSAVRGHDPAAARATSQAADMDERVDALRASIAAGQLAHIQAKIDALRARALDLPPGKRDGAARHLDALERQLARAVAREDARLEHRRGLDVAPTDLPKGDDQGQGTTPPGTNSGGTGKHSTTGSGSGGKSSHAPKRRTPTPPVVKPDSTSNGSSPSTAAKDSTGSSGSSGSSGSAGTKTSTASGDPSAAANADDGQ